MSRMNALIPLQVQQPDVVGSMDRGFRAGRRAGLADLYREHGDGIVSGNQNALTALARFDPQQAMQVQAQQQGMDIQRQQNARAASRFEQEQQIHQATQQLDKTLEIMMTARSPEEFVQLGNTAGLPMDDIDTVRAQWPNRHQYLQLMTLPPQQRLQAAAELEAQQNAPVKPADEYQRYVQEENAAGRKPLTRLEYAQAKKGAGTVITTRPDGSTVVSFGGAQAAGEDVTIGDAYNPSEVISTLNLIDEIAKDPALQNVTGALEGGGGNDVTQLNAGQRLYYGGDGLAVIQKINQLQSRAWIAARDMLKGGGQITDYESRKAEAAVARLERAQGDAEFKAALTDLRSAITDGMRKLQEAGQIPQGQPLPQAPAGGGMIATFTEMSSTDFVNVDIMTLSDEEFDAYEAEQQRRLSGE